MNANELKLAQAQVQARATIWINVFATARTLLVCGTIVWAFHEMFAGLAPLLDGKNAESIGAVAKVIQALHLGSVLGYGWGAIATGAWVVERNRKKK